MSHEPDGAIDHTGSLDFLRMCPVCSEKLGRPIFRHVSAFRVGHRGCAIDEAAAAVATTMRLQTTDVEWKPDHGAKPLVSDEERMN